MKNTNFEYNVDTPIDKLKLALHYFNTGELIKCEQTIIDHLKKYPRDVDAIRLLAHIVYKLNFLYKAESLMHKACALRPNDPAVLIEYASVLRKNLDLNAATEIFKKVYEDYKENMPAVAVYYAQDLMYRHEFEKALEVLLTTGPDEFPILKGHAYKFAGYSRSAEYCYSESDKGEAFFSLANMKTYDFDRETIEKMEAFALEREDVREKIYLCFALGHAYEKLEEYEMSFNYYKAGNAFQRSITPYDKELIREEFARIKAHKFDRKAKHLLPLIMPIFIVGLPRSGSTLVQQILSTDESVGVTTELPVIITQSYELRGTNLGNPKYPQSVNIISDEDMQALAYQYYEYVKIYCNDKYNIIDKMPNNFMHIGFIKTMFPNAKIIDIRRKKDAACFSVWKQLFASGHEYSYDYDDCSDYYDQYVDLMNHWHEQFPGEIFTLSYEALVNDPKSVLPALFDYCGLQYTENSLYYYKNANTAITPSSEQVKEPLNTKSVNQWKNYEKFLNPNR